VTSQDPRRPTAQAGRVWLLLALCWLVGVNLRTVILAVPPVLPLIQRDLRLSYTATGLIGAIPVLCMGVLAWPSAVLIGRIGGRAAVAAGLALVAVGALLRGVPPVAPALFGFTVVLSVGITLAQTSMPVLVRQWFPARVGLASTVYSNGLVIGEAVAVAVTGPLLLARFGADAWPATFAVWAAAVAVALALWLWFAPPAPPLGFHGAAPRVASTAGTPSAPGTAAPARRGQRVRGWHLGALLGSGSLAYFAANNWIPVYDQALGRATATTALAALNAAQLPVSLAVAIFAQRITGRRWPFVLAGAAVLVGLGGWLWAPASSGPLWAAVLGGGSSAVFILGTALPSLMATPGQVARLTGATLGIGYTLAFVGPLLGGGLLDLTHIPAMAFAPVAAAGVLTLVLGATLPTRAALGLSPASARGVERASPGG
jgi:MFS transporter, CP family, cyanate transporter